MTTNTLVEEIVESFKSLEEPEQSEVLKGLLSPEAKKALRKQKKAEYMRNYMFYYYRMNGDYAETVRQKGKDAYKRSKVQKETIFN